MRTRSTPFVALTAVTAILLGGSAARAIPSAPAAGARLGNRLPAPAEARAGRVAFRPVSGRGFPNPTLPAKTNIAPWSDALNRLPADGFAAYATGTVLHADPELSESGVAVTVDMAVADAVYAAQELSAFTDELGRPVSAGLPALSGRAHARAVMLDPPDAVDIGVDLGAPADSKAPPTNRPVARETTTDLEPVLKADLLRAEAAARAVSTGCVIGNDLARAIASADDTEIADTDFDPKKRKPLLALSADDPGPRAVSTTKSRTFLQPIPERPGFFEAISELRQTIAPVTFGLPGTDEKFTLEIGGEWVMRASTDGSRARLTFGPENSEDYERPALRLFRGDELIAVDLADLGDRTGIFIDGDPIGDIRIGGEPRAVNGRPGSRPVETGTRVAAASDVAVVRLFDPPAELHVGHMELGLAVPAGGVRCPGIGLTKTSDPETVRPGDTFTWNLEVSNPNDCLLDEVKVVDSPDASRGVNWQALTSVPRATRSPNGDLVFESIGGIATGETRSLQINAQVEPDSALGAITNRATAVGTCGDAPLAGGAETTTNVGMVTVPAVPRPPAGVPGSDRPVRRDSAGTSGSDSEEAAAATATSSASLTRSAPATRSASAAHRSAAVGGQRLTAEADRASAAPLARTGAESLPYGTLALALLGAGRVLRLAKTRRRS
jgi:hypothetical protein